MRAFEKKESPGGHARRRAVAIGRASALLAGCLVFFAARAQAAPSFQEAANYYNHGQYAQALTAFQAVNAASPNNPWVHYYMALSHQAVGHIEQAKTEYQWVVSSRDPRLAPQAQTGLSQLSGVRLSGGGGSGGSAPPAAYTPNASNGGARGQQASRGKISKVLDFWATW